MPSVDSYGDKSVFIRYKMNKWFEGMNVIRLKREQAKQHALLLKELYKRYNKVEKEIERKK